MIGQRSQEMEMRPSPEEMECIWDVPTIKYVTRQVGLITGPKLTDCGYCMSPTSPLIREMKFPTSGTVKYWVKSSKKLLSEKRLRRRLGNQGIDQEAIDSEVELLSRLERVSFESRGERWALCSIGGMQFARLRHTDKNGRIVYIGQLTDNGPYAAQDKLVQPQALECPGSDNKFWAPLVPRELSNKALPYNVDSEDEMKFDNHSEPPKYVEPSDGNNPHVILEKKQMRDASVRLLAPQSLRVSDALLGLAKNREEIGRALEDDQTLHEKTYERRGKLALDKALEDIRKVRQELAA
jgi:hypothetical protein